MRSVVRFAVISACKLNGTAFTHLVVSGSSIKQLVLEKFILGAAEHVMQNLMILNEAAAPTFQLGGPTLTCMCAHMAWGEIFIIDFFLLLLIIILVKHDKTLVYRLQLTPKPHEESLILMELLNELGSDFVHFQWEIKLSISTRYYLQRYISFSIHLFRNRNYH